MEDAVICSSNISPLSIPMGLLHADYNINNFGKKATFKLVFGEKRTQLFMTKIINNLT